MTRKRFIKLCMRDVDRNTAEFIANYALFKFKCYILAWEWLDGIVKGRFEDYARYYRRNTNEYTKLSKSGRSAL